MKTISPGEKRSTTPASHDGAPMGAGPSSDLAVICPQADGGGSGVGRRLCAPPPVAFPAHAWGLVSTNAWCARACRHDARAPKSTGGTALECLAANAIRGTLVNPLAPHRHCDYGSRPPMHHLIKNIACLTSISFLTTFLTTLSHPWRTAGWRRHAKATLTARPDERGKTGR